jgi:segregation and condensation protein B
LTDLSRAIEAILFLSPEPVTVVTLCELTEESPGAVQQALAHLVARHGEESALEVAEVGDGYALRTQADLVEVCDRLRSRPPEARLSRPALETLAVVAYLEPITRAEIAQLRGVSPDATISTLLERDLIEEAGQTPRGGTRYRTTPAFRERFGLQGRGSLPAIERFELTGPEAESIRARLSVVDPDERSSSSEEPDDS